MYKTEQLVTLIYCSSQYVFNTKSILGKYFNTALILVRAKFLIHMKKYTIGKYWMADYVIVLCRDCLGPGDRKQLYHIRNIQCGYSFECTIIISQNQCHNYNSISVFNFHQFSTVIFLQYQFQSCNFTISIRNVNLQFQIQSFNPPN